MSLDGALLHCVKTELTGLIGARVDKISQPSREEVVISLRMLGSADRSAKKLIFSANGASARVNLTSAEFENPQTPPMFCMILRKHLSGGKLVDIRQDGLERILYFDFECVNEIGDIVTNTLTAEIMGRHSNIILVRDGRVVDSIKRVTDEVSSVRRVLPNIVYETPPRANRLNILETDSGDILRQLDGRPVRLSKALPDILEGISPVFARECAFRTFGDVDALCSELDDEQRERFLEFIEDNAVPALNGSAKYTMLIDDTGKPRDFCFVDIGQYGRLMKVRHFDTANELLDGFYSTADKSERMRQRAHDLIKTLNTAYERVSRKVELQKKELAECGEREELRIKGDLINANIHRLKKGQTHCSVEDFYTGEPREIELDAKLTPAQNAQKYYSDYKKLDTAEKMLTGLIKKGGEELKYLDSVLDSVSRAENDKELSEIRRELREQGYLKTVKTEDKRSAKLSEPLKFRSADGFEILVGKNNRQNDLLTLKTAKATDIWLHTKDIAGSHVIIRTEGKTPSEQTLFEAAILAAYHSKARSGSGVPVDYVPVKFVKKPAGAKPGMVIFTNNKTLYVTPDENIVERLNAKG